MLRYAAAAGAGFDAGLGVGCVWLAATGPSAWLWVPAAVLCGVGAAALGRLAYSSGD